MKRLLLPAILILLAGCNYEIPLSQTPAAPANQALSGTWYGQATNETTSMKVEISGTEYSVTYGEDNNTLIFKGFEVKAGDLNLIQLELQNTDSQKYLFVKYELTPDRLIVYQLNAAVVSAKCQTADELLNDIAVHRQNPFLFDKPMEFSRSVPQ